MKRLLTTLIATFIAALSFAGYTYDLTGLGYTSNHHGAKGTISQTTGADYWQMKLTETIAVSGNGISDSDYQQVTLTGGQIVIYYTGATPTATHAKATWSGSCDDILTIASGGGIGTLYEDFSNAGSYTDSWSTVGSYNHTHNETNRNLLGSGGTALYWIRNGTNSWFALVSIPSTSFSYTKLNASVSSTGGLVSQYGELTETITISVL